MNITYNAVDIIALILIALETIMGIKRKAAGELFRLLCTGLVLLAAWRYYQDLGAQLAAYTRLSSTPDMADAIAFAIIIAVTGMACALLHLILGLLVQVQFNSAIDRLGGGLAGCGRGICLVVLMTFAAGIWPGEIMHEVFQQQPLVGRLTFRFAPPAIAKLRAINITFHHPTQDTP